MKYLKILLAVVAALVLAVMIFAITLPSDIAIERSIEINVPQGYAFEYLHNIENWEQWTVWKEYDSTLVYSYDGEKEGKGATQTWKGEHSPKASLHFTNVFPPKKIDFELKWNDGETSFSGYIKSIKSDESTTTIEWVHYKNIGWNPFMKLLGSMLDNVMGTNFENSLKNLKKQLELKYNVESKKLNVVTN